MATTSSTTAAGTAKAGRGDNGKGTRGRAGVALATAALGLSLVAGGVLAQGRFAAPQASTAPLANDAHVASMWDFREDRRIGATSVGLLDWEQTERNQVAPGAFYPDDFTYREDRRVGGVSGARIWTGTCRAGGSECLPDEEIVVPAQPSVSPRGWTGTCRAGSSDCLPDEDILIGESTGIGVASHDFGPADEYVDR